MAGLHQQVRGVIKTCETALASKRTDVYLDANTVTVAAAILTKAKANLSKDEILAAATLEGVQTWAQVLSVMQLVLHSLPSEPAQRGQAGGDVGGGGEGGWMR
jgi:hypothetical protein